MKNLILILAVALHSQEGLKAEKIHKVVKGDTLWGIAVKYYGDGFKWGKIYNKNLKIIKNPDLIYPDMELKIPEIEEIILPKLPEEKDLMQTSTTIATSTNSLTITEINTSTMNFEVKKIQIEEKQDYETLNGFELSNELPDSQLSSALFSKTIKVDKTFFDGKFLRKITEDELESEGLVNEGDNVEVKLYKGDFKPGDKLILYKKGISIGNKFTAQYAGALKIVEIKDRKAICQVIKISTSIEGEVFVKKFGK